MKAPVVCSLAFFWAGNVHAEGDGSMSLSYIYYGDTSLDTNATCLYFSLACGEMACERTRGIHTEKNVKLNTEKLERIPVSATSKDALDRIARLVEEYPQSNYTDKSGTNTCAELKYSNGWRDMEPILIYIDRQKIKDKGSAAYRLLSELWKFGEMLFAGHTNAVTESSFDWKKPVVIARPVSICEIVKKAMAFRGERVRVEGYLSFRNGFCSITGHKWADGEIYPHENALWVGFSSEESLNKRLTEQNGKFVEMEGMITVTLVNGGPPQCNLVDITAIRSKEDPRLMKQEAVPDHN